MASKVQIPDISREGFTLMVTLPTRQRDVQGPKSYTFYSFQPWSLVENRDVADMLAVTARVGCECNNDVRELHWFATAEQVRNGQAVPEWSM